MLKVVTVSIVYNNKLRACLYNLFTVALENVLLGYIQLLSTF